MKQEVALSPKDLQQAGISMQLTQNDLIEVVALEIYHGYFDRIREINRNAEKLRKMYESIMDAEFVKMKAELVKVKALKVTEEISTTFSGKEDYSQYKKSWDDTLSIRSFDQEEKNSGTLIKDKKYWVPVPKGKEAIVYLKISVDSHLRQNYTNIGDITGSVVTRTEKEFHRKLKVSTEPFMSLKARVMQHNKDFEDAENMLPDNRILSVDRFVREARVKMNKRMLAQQPAEFRKKMSELFKIKL